MGCDIHVALGKIKPLAIGYERKGSAIKLAGLGDDLDFSQFEFMDYDEECGEYDWEDEDRPSKDRELGRNYNLFSWLAGLRGDFEPVIPREKLDQLHELTIEFQKWADNEYRRLKQEQLKLEDGYYGQYEPTWSDLTITGDHSHVIYPLLFLKGFDYEQKPRVFRNKWMTEDHYHTLIQRYQDTTYREIFGDSYFNFLDWSLENGWHFVIFTFDS